MHRKNSDVADSWEDVQWDPVESESTTAAEAKKEPNVMLMKRIEGKEEILESRFSSPQLEARGVRNQKHKKIQGQADKEKRYNEARARIFSQHETSDNPARNSRKPLKSKPLEKKRDADFDRDFSRYCRRFDRNLGGVESSHLKSDKTYETEFPELGRK
jgi:hypothetical protein